MKKRKGIILILIISIILSVFAIVYGLYFIPVLIFLFGYLIYRSINRKPSKEEKLENAIRRKYAIEKYGKYGKKFSSEGLYHAWKNEVLFGAFKDKENENTKISKKK